MEKKSTINMVTGKQHKIILEALCDNPNGLNTFELRD
jgi:hypothetical protein